MKRTFSLLLAFVLLLALPSANCFALASCTTSDSVFTVNFYSWNSDLLSTQKVECGKGAVPPTAPFHNGYTFKGWDKPYTNVQSDLYIHAVYKETTLKPVTVEYFAMGDTLLYCLYLNRVDNTTLMKISLDYNTDVLEIRGAEEYGFACMSVFNTEMEGKVIFGAASTSDNFFSDTEPTCIILEFAVKDKSALTTTINAEISSEETGWYYDNVTHTTTVKLRENGKFVVVFLDADNTLLKIENVPAGSAATAPQCPTHPGFEFTGWDTDFSVVTSDLIVTAQYNCVAVMGDVNLDGEVNTGDAVLILKATVGAATLNDLQRVLADCNGDNELNTGDAVAILKFCVGASEQHRVA